jgi:hypothetical protein
MTLGNAAAAQVGLIVWCRVCTRQIELDPVDLTRRYGGLHHRSRSVRAAAPFPYGSRRVDMVVGGPKRR